MKWLWQPLRQDLEMLMDKLLIQYHVWSVKSVVEMRGGGESVVINWDSHSHNYLAYNLRVSAKRSLLLIIKIFIKIKNSKGSTLLPCGTPEAAVKNWDRWPLGKTYCFLLTKRDEKNDNSDEVKPTSCSLASKVNARLAHLDRWS